MPPTAGRTAGLGIDTGWRGLGLCAGHGRKRASPCIPPGLEEIACGADSDSGPGFAVVPELIKNGQENNQGIPPFLNQ
jgi:hypothetical protein